MTGIPPIAGSVAAATPPARKLTADFDMFVKMLVTQVQNQDPLSPMDTAQYTQQLATYSQVEQAIAANEKLEKILGSLSAGSLTEATRLVGRDIGIDGPDAVVQDGAARWSFGRPLSRAASWEVTSPDGAVLARGELDRGASLRWDAPAGLAEGSRVRLALRDRATGAPLDLAVGNIARVTAVAAQDGRIQAELGGRSVGVESIRRVE